MFQNFADLDRTFAALNALQRQLWERSAVVPDAVRFSADDHGDAWVVRAELPGVPKEAVELTLTGQVLRLSASRKTRPPVDGDDIVAHRAERPAFTFQRSITLPHKVDAERVSAEHKDGVLTVTLPKSADARPRAIAVR